MDQFVALTTGHEVVVTLRDVAPVGLDGDRAAGPLVVLPDQERHEAAPVEVKAVGHRDTSEVEHRRENVDVSRNTIRGVARFEVRWPVDKQR